MPASGVDGGGASHTADRSCRLERDGSDRFRNDSRLAFCESSQAPAGGGRSSIRLWRGYLFVGFCREREDDLACDHVDHVNGCRADLPVADQKVLLGVGDGAVPVDPWRHSYYLIALQEDDLVGHGDLHRRLRSRLATAPIHPCSPLIGTWNFCGAIEFRSRRRAMRVRCTLGGAIHERNHLSGRTCSGRHVRPFTPRNALSERTRTCQT
jgi:hypothetical protein